METLSRLKIFIVRTINLRHPMLIRLIVGLIFLSEGIQKFMFPDLAGAGRFEEIGFTDPVFWANFTGAFEITGGLLILIGYLTRLAAIPLFIIMIVAFVTTKYPILYDRGFWAMAHEYRTDFALTILLIYLFIYGAGKWSVDSTLY